VATLVAAVAVSLGVPAVATAGQVKGVEIVFAGGRVSLAVEDATASQVLAEWSRTGKTEVIGAELAEKRRVTGVKLVDVSESEALEAILGPSFGFVEMVRAAEPGLSTIRRLVIGEANPPDEKPVDPSMPPEARYSYYVPDKVLAGDNFGTPVYEKLDPRWTIPEKRFEYFSKEFATFEADPTPVPVPATYPEVRFKYFVGSKEVPY
jgi:hypothetical protein